MMIEKRPETAVVKVEPKKGVNWPAVYQYLLDYCNDTTIHGFKVIQFSSCQIEISLDKTVAAFMNTQWQILGIQPRKAVGFWSFVFILGRVVNPQTFLMPWITFGYTFSPQIFLLCSERLHLKLTFIFVDHFQYMGETSRPWIERIFWMVAFIISTIGCALLIAEMFEKLQTNPITVSLAERPSSIQEVNEPYRN